MSADRWPRLYESLTNGPDRYSNSAADQIARKLNLDSHLWETLAPSAWSLPWLTAVLDAMDALDGALDDTHPEGDGCDICHAATELRDAIEDTRRLANGEAPDGN